MKLSTSTVGNGPKRVALVHGLSGDGGTWFELAPWIAEHGYTVTLVDQRGHGDSDRADSYQPEDFGNDLVDTLPVGLDLIIGHSLGGRSLTSAVDRLRPAKAVYMDPGWVIPDGLVIAPPVHEDGSWFSIEELGEVLVGYSRPHLEQALRSLSKFDLKILGAPTFPLQSMMPAETPVVPSLVITADPSIHVPADLQEKLIADGYTVRVLPGGAHDMHVLNLEATKDALEDWL